MSGLEGWLAVNDDYDGEDYYIGTNVELYSRGPHRGERTDVVRWLEQFDCKYVRITVQEVEHQHPDAGT